MLGALMDALGYVGSALDKPGAAVRGALAGRPEQLLNLVPFSDAAGLTREEDRVSGKGLLQHYGALGEEDDSLLGGALGAGADVLTNPLTYGGGGALLKALGLARGSAAPAMLSARRGMTFAKGVDEGGRAGRLVGGAEGALSRQGAEEVARRVGEGSRQGLQGMYQPGANAGAILKGVGPNVQRHELVHGLVDQASQGGGEGLPWLVRASGRLHGPNPQRGAREGLATLLEEVTAHSLEHKGLLNQVGGAADFLFAGGPGRQAYVNILKDVSPAVGLGFEHLPALTAAGGMGVAGGVGLGLPYLLGGRE